MVALAVGFALGASLLARMADLPPAAWAWAGLLALPLCRWPVLRVPAGLVLGFCHAWQVAGGELDERLPESLDGASFRVVGSIESLPEEGAWRSRFNLRVERLSHEGRAIPGPDLVRLSWYDDAPRLAPGQRWSLAVKLSRPHGFANPGGFDYERWLFREGIDATGYVNGDGKAGQPNTSAAAWLDRLRARVAERIHRIADDATTSALLRALAVGDRRGLSDEMWHTLNATGTNHLVAISGLHIGLVASLGMGLAIVIARRITRLTARIPARIQGAGAALFLAAVYAALAGFTLPTRRALVMVCVVLVAIAARRAVRPWQALAAALLSVLLLDPLAPLGPGFWLSFGAVGFLILAYAGVSGRSSRLRSLAGAQWVVGLGLAPVVAAQFQRVALAGPLVNTLAIPLVGLVAVPLVLAGTGALLVPGPLAHWLLGAAGLVLCAFWTAAEGVAGVPGATAPVASPNLPALLAALAGAAWLLGPKGLPARALGLVLMIPLLFPVAPALPHGGFRLGVLDVGQGLAVVVRTSSHALVYDTGPAFRSGFSTARAVVDPYLRQTGIARLDVLVVSHGDSDHAGGARWLSERFPVERIIASGSTLDRGADCRDGLGWSWDGVRFTTLHPPRGMPYLGNASSCVLRIEGARGSALLTGDITRVVERRLVSKHPRAIDADVLVAPHHGSDSSSSRRFIRAVAPRWVVFSAGKGNPFGLPDEHVVARYRELGAGIVNTARAGMVRFRLTPGNGAPEPLRWRMDRRRYWTDRPGRH